MKTANILASSIFLIFNMHAMELQLSNNNNNNKSEKATDFYTFKSSDNHEFTLDAKIAHKSPVFEAMFKSGMQEQKENK